MGAEVDPATVTVLLAEVPRCIVASPTLLQRFPDVVEPSSLSALPWIAISTFYQHEVVLTHPESEQTESIAIASRLSTDSLYVAKNAALAGVGVAVVSSWTVEEELANGSLVELLPQWQTAPLPVHLVYPWARYYPIRLRKFLDLMREVMPQIAGMRQPEKG